jgi:crotonobetainyl-CoA:carnitine CoA-transferase CaiB-like acyl-CoA transferase
VTQHPNAGPVTQVGWPAPVAGQPFEVVRPAPSLGEHTEEVLRELRFPAERIDALRRASVI